MNIPTILGLSPLSVLVGVALGNIPAVSLFVKNKIVAGVEAKLKAAATDAATAVANAAKK